MIDKGNKSDNLKQL